MAKWSDLRNIKHFLKYKTTTDKSREPITIFFCSLTKLLHLQDFITRNDELFTQTFIHKKWRTQNLRRTLAKVSFDALSTFLISFASSRHERKTFMAAFVPNFFIKHKLDNSSSGSPGKRGAIVYRIDFSSTMFCLHKRMLDLLFARSSCG